jgi:hypothetical protein
MDSYLSSESCTPSNAEKQQPKDNDTHQHQCSNDSVDMIAGRAHVVKFLAKCESGDGNGSGNKNAF